MGLTGDGEGGADGSARLVEGSNRQGVERRSGELSEEDGAIDASDDGHT